jgi:hypothetical protein
VTTARCPACGASVLDGAPWCTLCYADLRVPAPASVPATAPPSASSSSPGGVDLLAPTTEASVSSAAGALGRPVSWPCGACGAPVALEHDTCPQCLTPFLAGADPAAAMDLPLVGAFRPLTATKTSRLWLMIGGTVVVSVVLTVVITLIGLLL